MTAIASDFLSEQLIAKLLQDDLALLESVKQAEKLQLDQVLAASAQAAGRIPKYSKLNAAAHAADTDRDLAFQMYISDTHVMNDAAYAQAIQSAAFTGNAVDRMYAQKLAANERKVSLDAEFARRLQAIDERGQDIDAVKDAESILGDLKPTFDPNAVLGATEGKGPQAAMKPPIKTEDVDMDQDTQGVNHGTGAKGKGRQFSVAPDPAEAPYPTCGICLDPFLATHSPISASLSANSSSRLPFGLSLPCPKDHAYCISCLTSYIQNKLDPDGRGVGKSSTGPIVFPIRCPECPLVAWPGGIDDDVAVRVLGEHGMVEWHHQKLLDSIPRLFCPNPKCSSPVEADEDSDDPQAICPQCQKIMCVPCRTLWHQDLTCEEYQALPIDERSPEDRLVLDLAKAEQWRRCPNCSVIVEHVSGCNHMTCRCGFHFCFKCESPTTEKGLCTRDPPCDLWDEEMLLEVRERQRNRDMPQPQPVAVQHRIGFAYAGPAPVRLPEYHYQPPQQARHAHHDDLNWMDDPAVLCRKHWFTVNMVTDLRCGYCDIPLNSLADLRYHLSHVQHHPVYACCGRFFRRRIDFERHEGSGALKFGYHAYQMVHD